MGCGRVGAALSASLHENGHSVAVIDQDPEAFRRLHSRFEGRTVVGLGFDRNTLKQAGIEDAYAFAAVSSGDNSNILGARVARETFGVDKVVARIYDPHRAEVFQRMGIPTVATVRWTADQVMRRMLPEGASTQFSDASGKIVLIEYSAHPDWVGRPLRDLEQATGGRVAFFTRLGEGQLPTEHTVVQEGDLIHLSIGSDAVAATDRVIFNPPSHEEGQP